MPYKSGKLKGQLTTAELRKLIKAHNKLFTIKVPTGATQPEIIKLINDNGYIVNHQKQELRLRFKKLPQKITMDDVPKKVEPTALQKQKRAEAQEERKRKRKKEIRQAKIEAVTNFQKGQPKPSPKPKSKPKPVTDKPKPKPVVKKKPTADKPKPKRRQIGKTNKPEPTIEPQRVIPKPPPKKPPTKKPSGDMVRKVKVYPFTKLSQATRRDIEKKFDKINVDVVFISGGVGIQKSKEQSLIDQGRTLYDGKDATGEIQPLVKLKPVKRRKAKQPLEEGDYQKIGVKGTGKRQPEENPKLEDIEVIQINKQTYPLDVSKYDDVRDIPFEDIWKNLVDKRSNIFYPFTGIKGITDILYYGILEDNKNICALPKKYYNDLLKLTNLVDRKKLKGKPKEWKSYRNPSMMLNRLRGIIATKFVSCASMMDSNINIW